MPADPETLTALTEIKTLLGVEIERSKEDRKAGAEARDKIDSIHTTTQAGFVEIKTELRGMTSRLENHAGRIEANEKRIGDNSLNMAKVGGVGAVGGGVFAGMFAKVFEWFTTGSEPHQ